MQSLELTFSAQARYYKSGDVNEATRSIWIVMHGYGQLAQYFIRNFAILEAHNICVIAPEGLSRFYLEDVSARTKTGNNRVGASWMTRENRQMDIDNYITFLNAIHEKELRNTNIPVTILGFSQGAATASRWAMTGTFRFSRLILWAGIFPPDMDLSASKERLAKKEVYVVYGTRDPFLTDDRFAEMNQLSEKLGVTPSVVAFDGEHKINEEALLKLI